MTLIDTWTKLRAFFPKTLSQEADELFTRFGAALASLAQSPAAPDEFDSIIEAVAANWHCESDGCCLSGRYTERAKEWADNYHALKAVVAPAALAGEREALAKLPSLATLKIVVREAFMNGLGWMEGNRESAPKDWNEAADWFVGHWESSENNPLNYPHECSHPTCGCDGRCEADEANDRVTERLRFAAALTAKEMRELNITGQGCFASDGEPTGWQVLSGCGLLEIDAAGVVSVGDKRSDRLTEIRRDALAAPATVEPAPDTQRCIDARNKLNAAVHGEGAVIDDLERVVDAACRIIDRWRFDVRAFGCGDEIPGDALSLCKTWCGNRERCPATDEEQRAYIYALQTDGDVDEPVVPGNPANQAPAALASRPTTQAPAEPTEAEVLARYKSKHGLRPDDATTFFGQYYAGWKDRAALAPPTPVEVPK